MEVIYSDHLVLLPDHLRDDKVLKSIIKSIVQMPFLRYWQAWHIDHSSREPDQVSDYPLGKETFLNAKSEAHLV